MPEHPWITCEGLLFFCDVRAALGLDACSVFPQVVQAVISLIGRGCAGGNSRSCVFPRGEGNKWRLVAGPSVVMTPGVLKATGGSCSWDTQWWSATPTSGVQDGAPIPIAHGRGTQTPEEAHRCTEKEIPRAVPPPPPQPWHLASSADPGLLLCSPGCGALLPGP